MPQTRVFISGRVQGVYFRDYTRREAEKLSLSGWVRNLPDRRVEAVFQGPAEKIRQMIDWCWQGSPMSRVDNVEVLQEEGTETYQGFTIRG